jgi:bla regulator protein blaR1
MSAVSVVVFLANHLWQSTIFATVAGVLTLTLKKNRAQIRYWLWVMASVKFLIPLALVASLESHFQGITGAPMAVQPGSFAVLEQWNEPFAKPEVATSTLTAAGKSVGLWPAAALVVWLVGCAIVATSSCWRWRRMVMLARQATPLLEGPEVDTLRLLQCQHGFSKPIPIVLSKSTMEPGLFGIVYPVLLLPADIGNHVDDAQLGTIFAHELSHARRRDNFVRFPPHDCRSGILVLSPRLVDRVAPGRRA